MQAQHNLNYNHCPSHKYRDTRRGFLECAGQKANITNLTLRSHDHLRPQGWNKDSASSPWNGLWRPWSTKCKICSLSFTIADGWIFRLSQEARLFISLLSSSQSATGLPFLSPESCDESQRTTMHNVHFVKYDGTVVKSWNPKIHFLTGKKYFWGYFSYVVLGRKL